MANFKAFLILKNIFSKLNPMPAFKWRPVDDEIRNPPSSKELLEKVIEKYPEFEKVILIAIYHLINTQNTNNEYLTVLTKDLRLIADLVEGDYGEVSVPQIVKEESKRGNVLITCHNHFKGAVIASLTDFKNTICPKIRFAIIVSDNNIGILVNEFDNFNKKTLNLLKVDLKDYVSYVIFNFVITNEKEIENLDSLNLDEEMYSIEYQKLFDKYISKNNLKFINEFNCRMKKYKLYYLYIKY